jgi:alpha-galactosidase
MSQRIAMIGAGSPGFSRAVAKEMCCSESLKDSTFVLMDIDERRLNESTARIHKIAKEYAAPLKIETTLDRREALYGCDFVITSCEKKRIPYWIKDIEIPEKYGVHQLTGENGGPGGIIHAMRNISLFMEIAKDMKELCPDAWIMNFTNPMSFICTYLLKYSGINSVGLCHQVHGSFGVVAEMLGMPPGELEVLTGGINHMNWLVDVRKRNTGKSYMLEFLECVKHSKYWKQNMKNIPQQKFTLEVLEVFGAYPVGYDDHICEYMPFFYEKKDWQKLGYEGQKNNLKKLAEKNKQILKTDDDKALMELRTEKYPFPKDPNHPYYHEKACEIIEALITNSKVYLDSVVTLNHGSIENLPNNAIVDVPAVVAGGEVRSTHVGKLPIGCAELCRRQISIHEIVVKAVMEGNRELVLQALCLDPYIKSINETKKIFDDFIEEYKEDLPQFI